MFTLLMNKLPSKKTPQTTEKCRVSFLPKMHAVKTKHMILAVQYIITLALCLHQYYVCYFILLFMKGKQEEE